MRIPFLSHVSEKEQENIRRSLNRVTLKDVLSGEEYKQIVEAFHNFQPNFILEAHVHESLDIKGFNRQRLVRIRFEFLSRRDYFHQFCVTPASVLVTHLDFMFFF